MTERQLSKKIEKIIKREGGIPYCKGYRGFPAAACINTNHILAHGVPGNRKFQDGDIVGVDVVVKADNLLADACRTFSIGEGSQKGLLLLSAAKKATYAGIEQLGPDKDLYNACRAMYESIIKQGFTPVLGLHGHGINPELHMSPYSEPSPLRGKPQILKVGQMLTIEPHLMCYSGEIKLASDGQTYYAIDSTNWSAMHEETILITEDGYEVLTGE